MVLYRTGIPRQPKYSLRLRRFAETVPKNRLLEIVVQNLLVLGFLSDPRN